MDMVKDAKSARDILKETIEACNECTGDEISQYDALREVANISRDANNRRAFLLDLRERCVNALAGLEQPN
jgi:hypothetical protein